MWFLSFVVKETFLSESKIQEFLKQLLIWFCWNMLTWQVCSLNDKATILHPLFLGLVSSCGADVGITMFESSKGEGEDECDMIFSMRHIIRLSRQIEKLQFCAVPEQHVHVEQVDDELVTNYPDAPNSYRLHCPMYASLNSCSLDAVCVVKVFE